MKVLSWEENFELLKEYLKQHNGEYPKRSDSNHYSLSRWVNTQRTICNNGELQEDGSIRDKKRILTKEKVDKLKSIGVKTREYLSWDENYNLLKLYLEQNSGQYPTENPSLASWVITQRVIYNNGEKQQDGGIRYKSYILRKEQIDKLNLINFKWNINKMYTWEEKIDLLKQYLSENNGIFPLSKEKYKNFNIGEWITKLRKIYNAGEKQEDGSILYETDQNHVFLTKKQIEELNLLNFEWKSNTFDEIWINNLSLLEEYLIEHNGKYPTAQEYYKGVSIGHWVQDQRIIYNNGEKSQDGVIRYNGKKLTPKRIEMLKNINFKWRINYSDVVWDKNFNLFEEYLKEHNGKYPTAYEYYKDFNIGKWVISQRSIYNNGEKQDDESFKYDGKILTKDKIDRLNSIDFKWKINCSDETWNKNYELLKEYLKNHDNNYPSSYEFYKGLNLGQWVGMQRTIYNNGELQEDGTIRYGAKKYSIITQERIEKLNEINFEWVVNKNNYYSKEIKTKEELEKKKRYLLLLLNKQLLNQKQELSSKKDVDKLNEMYFYSLKC